jgi:hypothetical protein
MVTTKGPKKLTLKKKPIRTGTGHLGPDEKVKPNPAPSPDDNVKPNPAPSPDDNVKPQPPPTPDDNVKPQPPPAPPLKSTR